jgi:hypothetical protein
MGTLHILFCGTCTFHLKRVLYCSVVWFCRCDSFHLELVNGLHYLFGSSLVCDTDCDHRIFIAESMYASTGNVTETCSSY